MAQFCSCPRMRRLLRLIRTAKSLRIMFNTLLVTLPSVFNIGALLGLVYFIYAILAMQVGARGFGAPIFPK